MERWGVKQPQHAGLNYISEKGKSIYLQTRLKRRYFSLSIGSEMKLGSSPGSPLDPLPMEKGFGMRQRCCGCAAVGMLPGRGAGEGCTHKLGTIPLLSGELRAQKHPERGAGDAAWLQRLQHLPGREPSSLLAGGCSEEITHFPITAAFLQQSSIFCTVCSRMGCAFAP